MPHPCYTIGKPQSLTIRVVKPAKAIVGEVVAQWVQKLLISANMKHFCQGGIPGVPVSGTGFNRGGSLVI